jgi:hypothetical protein
VTTTILYQKFELYERKQTRRMGSRAHRKLRTDSTYTSNSTEDEGSSYDKNRFKDPVSSWLRYGAGITLYGNNMN